MRRYRINNQVYCDDEPGFQEALELAHKNKIRPVCECRPGGVEMYVAKVNGKVLVKRMPNSGDQHTPSCEAYEPPPELSGLGQVLGSAIDENVEDGKTNLKLGFSLSKGAGRTNTTAAAVEGDSVKTDGNKLTLRGTLHYLWEQSGFNKWSPAMQDRRNWYVIRKYLMRAAAEITAKGQELEDVLYMPESFRVDKKDEIAQRRNILFSRITGNQSRGRRLNILVGEVKDISKSHYGHKMMVKHVPDMGFMLNEDLHRRLEKRFAVELGLWASSNEVMLMVIGTFGVSINGIATMEEVSLMVVDTHWLPIESMVDLMLVNKLVEQDRRFTKGLRYNLPSQAPLASAVLTDVHPDPVALYIIPPGAEDEYAAATEDLIEASHLQSWTWRAGEQEMPKLPPKSEPPREWSARRPAASRTPSNSDPYQGIPEAQVTQEASS